MARILRILHCRPTLVKRRRKELPAIMALMPPAVVRAAPRIDF